MIVSKRVRRCASRSASRRSSAGRWSSPARPSPSHRRQVTYCHSLVAGLDASALRQGTGIRPSNAVEKWLGRYEGRAD